MMLIFNLCSIEVSNDPRNSAGDVSWTHGISVIVQGNQVDLGQDGAVTVSYHDIFSNTKLLHRGNDNPTFTFIQIVTFCGVFTILTTLEKSIL